MPLDRLARRKARQGAAVTAAVVVVVAAGWLWTPGSAWTQAAAPADRSSPAVVRATSQPDVRPSDELPSRVGPTRVWAGAFPPAGWQNATFDDGGWRPTTGGLVPRGALANAASTADGPVRDRTASGDDSATTAIDAPPGSSFYTRTTFDLEQPRRARVLELRIAYQDGFVAYLNGREVARRGVPTSPAGARPVVTHGHETERIYLPVAATGSSPAVPPSLLAATGNILAVELRPAVGRGAATPARAPTGQIGLAVFSGVRIVRGPYLNAPTDGGLSVTWETDLPARGSVTVSPAEPGAQTPRRFSAPRPGLRQVVNLSPLSRGTRYRYQVDVEGAQAGAPGHYSSAPALFTTSPRPDQPLRFIVYGDMRAPGHQVHARVVAGIVREQPALVLNTGDLVAVGSQESAWQRYFDITAPLGAIAPVAPVLGNHEAYLNGAAKSWALFGLRSAAGPQSRANYTSFDWGGAHFILLDTNQPGPDQRAWLARDLAAARKRRVRGLFAFCHDGPWSHGPHGGSASAERDFAPLLADAGADILFSGHDHIYERGTGATARGPLTYVVTGGGGAPLYRPTCQPAAAVASVSASASGGAATPLPTCPPSVAALSPTHHYIVVEVNGSRLSFCPRQPDGQAVEPCVQLPLHAPVR